MFNVKFGTLQPITFHEIEKELGIDESVRGRLFGSSYIESYDSSLYESDEKVSEFIKQNAAVFLEVCLNDKWDKNLAVLSKWQEHLGGLFDDCLAEMGITAKTSIVNLSIVFEDMERLQELKVNSPKYQPLNMPDIVFIDDVVPPPAPPLYFGMKPWMVDGPGAYPPNPDIARYIKKGGNPTAGYKPDKYCRNCGAELTLGMNYCSECGNKLQ